MLPTTPCGPLRRRASSSLCHVATDKRGAQNWPPALAHTITEARHVSWAAQLKEWLNELYPEDNGLGILPNGTVGPDVDNSPVYTARIKRINGIGEYPIMYAVWCVADRIASLSDTTPDWGPLDGWHLPRGWGPLSVEPRGPSRLASLAPCPKPFCPATSFYENIIAIFTPSNSEAEGK